MTADASAQALVPADNVTEIPEGFVRLMLGENPFVDMIGPLYGHQEEGLAGRLVLGLRIEKRHCSPSGFAHGGLLMTLGDMLLVLGANVQTGLNRFMTTVHLTGDFMQAVPTGAWVEGRLQVLRTTKSLIFCQGLYTVGGEPVLRVDGIVKPIGDEKPAGALLRYFGA